MQLSGIFVLGAEVVGGDLDDPTSILNAVSGCHGVFGVTNYWPHNDKEKEVKQVIYLLKSNQHK